MTKNRVVLVALLVVVAGLVVWRIRSHHADEPQAPAVTQTGSSGLKIERPAAAKPAHLTVAVSDAKGPVGSALVRVVGGDGDTIVLHAGADGIATSDALEPGAYRIAASAPDHEPASASRELHAGEDARVAITLPGGGRTLAGTVTDASGGPIAGVRIDAAKLGGTARPSDAIATTLTGTDGHYKMSVAEGQLLVAAAHPDYSPQSRYVEVGAAGATADFSLVPGAVVEGTVRDATTKTPIAAATVTARRDRGGVMALAEGGRHRATTGADGRFRLSGLRPGAYELMAHGAGKSSRSPVLVGVGVAEQVTDVDILIGVLPVVRGTVVDEAGKPAAGVHVSALGQGPSSDVDSASDGSFVLEGLTPGHYVVAGASEEYVLVTGAPIDLASTDIDKVKVVVRRGLQVKGHVEPRQVAEVSLDLAQVWDDNHPPGAVTELPPITTGADGEFVFSPATPTHATLTARCTSGDQGSQAIEITPKLGDVVVRVAPGASIAGRVVDGEGKPIAGTTVMASTTGDSDRTTIVNGMITSGVRAVTGSTGTFELDGLAAGTYRLSVLDRGRPMKMKGKVPVMKLAANEHKTGVELAVDRPNGTIKGRVVGADGKALADAWVSLHQDIDEMLSGMMPAPDDVQGGSRMITVEASGDDSGGGVATNELPPALTDASGNFTITGVPSGTWDVVAEAQAGKLRGRANRVTPDATVTITATGVTELDGTVHGANGVPALFDVELDGPTKAQRSFAGSGAFSFSRVDPGDYTVKVTSADGNGEAKVTVTAGNAANVDVPLVANAIVVGKLVDPSGQPVAGLPVTLIPDTGDGRIQVSLQGPPPVSGADGSFRLESKAGKMTLIVLSPPSPTTKPGLVLEGGKTLDVGSVTVAAKPPAPPEKRERVTQRGHDSHDKGTTP